MHCRCCTRLADLHREPADAAEAPVTGAVVCVVTLRAHQHVRRACKADMKSLGRACQKGARLQRGAQLGASLPRVRTRLRVLETHPGKRHTHTHAFAVSVIDALDRLTPRGVQLQSRSRRHGKASTHSHHQVRRYTVRMSWHGARHVEASTVPGGSMVAGQHRMQLSRVLHLGPARAASGLGASRLEASALSRRVPSSSLTAARAPGRL